MMSRWVVCVEMVDGGVPVCVGGLVGCALIGAMGS